MRNIKRPDLESSSSVRGLLLVALLSLLAGVVLWAADTALDGLSDEWKEEVGLSAQPVASTNLVGWWQFEETNGTTAWDRSPSGLPLRAVNAGGTLWTTNGLFYRASILPSTNTYFQAATNAAYSLSSNGFTWIAWVRGANSTNREVLAKWINGSGAGWRVEATENGQLSARFDTPTLIGQTLLSTNTPVVIKDDAWHQAALSYEPTTGQAHLYLDGGLEDAKTVTGSYSASVSNFTFGGAASDLSWPGLLDETRYYNRVLTADEIAQAPLTFYDADGDGLSNWEEMHQGTDPLAADTDGDGIPDGTDPMPVDYYNGSLPTISIDSGNGQTGVANAFASAPLIVFIADGGATPLVNAPVVFSIASGTGTLNGSGAGPTSTTVTVRTDSEGKARAYLKFGTILSGATTISAKAISGSTQTGVTFSATTSAASGLTIWLKADAGVTLDGAGNVSTWTDQIAGLAYGQGTSYSRPALVSNVLNGKPSTRWNGTQVLVNGDNLASQLGGAVTIVAVGATSDQYRNHYQFRLGLTNGYGVNRGMGQNGGLQAFEGYNAWATGGALGDFPARYTIDATSVNSALNYVTFYRDGVQSGGQSVAGAGLSTLSAGSTIGAFGSAGLNWSGDIAEILVFNRELSLSETNAVGGELADKYGLYHPSATWPQSYPTAIQGLIAGNKWTKTQADTYAAGMDSALGSSASGLAIWLKADAGPSLDGSGNVSTWTDQVLGLAYGQGTSSARPALVSSILDGKLTTRWNGTKMLVNGDDMTQRLGGALTIVTVGATSDQYRNHYEFRLGLTNGYGVNRGMGQNGGYQAFEGYNAWASGAALTDLSRYTIDAESVNSALNYVTFYRDGVQTGGQTVAGAGLTTLSVGSAIGAYGSAGLNWSGDISEILVFDRELTLSQVNAVGGKLADKYGIYHPNATWPLAYSSAVQSQIATCHFTKAEAEVYAAAQTSELGSAAAGIAFWLKADAGVTTDSSGNVNSWVDQATGKPMEQAVAGSRPALVTASLNGKPVVHFTGSQVLTNAGSLSSSLSGAITLVTVSSSAVPSATQYSFWAGFSYTTVGASRALGNQSGLRIFDACGVGSWGGPFSATPGRYEASVVTLDSAWHDVTFYRDGAPAASATLSSGVQAVSPGLAVGAAGTLGYGWNGDIVEVMAFDHVLSSTQLEQVGVYLADKYGLYHPAATWPLAYSSAVQSQIATYHFTKAEADVYAAAQTSELGSAAAGIAFWVKADAGVTTDSSGNVSSWVDQATGMPMKQAVAGSRPALVASGFGGKPVVRFTGTQVLTNAASLSSSLGGAITLVSVSSSTAPATMQYSFWAGFSYSTVGASRGFGNQAGSRLVDVCGFGASGPSVSATPTQYEANIATVDSTLHDVTFYRDGALAGSATLTGSVQPLTPGVAVGAVGTAGYGWNGDIVEVMAFDHVLSSTQLDQVNAYFADKYGLYNPTAAWMDAFSPEVKTEIVARHWRRDQALAYVALLAAHPTLPLTGVEMWLKADAGVTTGGDGLVSAWADQSPNGNDAIYTSNADDTKPLLVSDAGNGNPALKFSGGQALRVANQEFLNPGEFTMIVVGRHNAANDQASYLSKFDAGTHTTGYALLQEPGGTMGAWVGNAGQHVERPAFTHSFATLAATYGSATLTFFQDNDAGVARTVTGTITNSQPLCIGGQKLDGIGKYVDGDIAEVLFYHRILSPTERAAVDAYLSEKYGLYRPDAAWINAYTAPVQSEIRRLAWSKETADRYVTWLASAPPIPAQGVALWLKADAGVTSSSGNVSVWQDQSFHHNNAFQATSARQPTLVADGYNAGPVIRFSGASQFLTVADSPSLRTPQVTIVAIAKPNQSASPGQILSKPYQSDSWQSPFVSYQLGVTAANELSSKLTTSIGAYSQETTTETVGGSMHVLAAAFGTGQQALYLDGAQLVAGSPFGDVGCLPAISDLALGSRSPGSPAESFIGDVAELIVYDHLLSEGERDALSAYATSKYTLTPVRTPVISPAGGDYLSTVTVTLSTATTGATIRYTVDGSAPTTASTAYSAPFTVAVTQKVRAKAFLGSLESAIAEAIYWVNDPGHTGLNGSGSGVTPFQMPLIDIDFDPEAVFTPDEPTDPPQIILFRPTNAVPVP